MFGKRVKEHNSQVTSAIYKPGISNNHPSTNMSHFKVTDQDSKHIVREAGKVIYIRINNPAQNCNTGKMYIPEIFIHLLETSRSSYESNQVVDSDLPLGHTHLIIPATGSPEQNVWQIK